MKTLILGAAALVLGATVALADGHSKTVRMGTEGAYPPYNFINDDGEIDGFERELGDELCARTKMTCEWVKNDWDSIIPNLVSGNYDTIMAGMSITDERDEVIDFTQNYIPPQASAYVAASDGVDLVSGVISAQTATLQAGYIANSDAVLVEFATPEETVAAVRNGEADAVFANKDYLTPLVEASGGELMFVGADVPLGGGVGMGLRESDGEIRDKFDAAITSMKADGTLNTMLIKWFGDDADTY
ncbi:MAG: transporter substrate-binding domain-containing protein [Sedimentitalea sp.]